MTQDHSGFANAHSWLDDSLKLASSSTGAIDPGTQLLDIGFKGLTPKAALAEIENSPLWMSTALHEIAHYLSLNNQLGFTLTFLSLDAYVKRQRILAQMEGDEPVPLNWLVEVDGPYRLLLDLWRPLLEGIAVFVQTAFWDVHHEHPHTLVDELPAPLEILLSWKSQVGALDGSGPVDFMKYAKTLTRSAQLALTSGPSLRSEAGTLASSLQFLSSKCLKPYFLGHAYVRALQDSFIVACSEYGSSEKFLKLLLRILRSSTEGLIDGNARLDGPHVVRSLYGWIEIVRNAPRERIQALSRQRDAIDVLHYLVTGEQREGYLPDPFQPARSLARRLPLQWKSFRDFMQASPHDAERYVTAACSATLTLNLSSRGRVRVLGIVPGGFAAQDAVALRVDDMTWWLGAGPDDIAALRIPLETLVVLPADAMRPGTAPIEGDGICELEIDCFIRMTPSAAADEPKGYKSTLLCTLSAPCDPPTKVLVEIAPAIPGKHPPYLRVADEEFHHVAQAMRERIRSVRTLAELAADLLARGDNEGSRCLQSWLESQDSAAQRIRAQIDRRILSSLLGVPPRNRQLDILAEGVAAIAGATELSREIELAFAKPTPLPADKLKKIEIVNCIAQAEIGTDLFSVDQEGRAWYLGLWGKAALLARDSARKTDSEAVRSVSELQLYQRFLPVFESLAKMLEIREVPLIILRLTDLEAFNEQLSGLVRGTVIFSSQDDFREQLLRNISTGDFLVVVIEHRLSSKDFDLIGAYLRAHDILLDDSKRRELDVDGVVPSPEHRMVLVVDNDTFNSYDAERARFLREFAFVNATLLFAQ